MPDRHTTQSLLRSRLALFLLIASGWIGGCAPSEEAPPRPVLLIGIDGAEWRVIEKLWEDGELPHLRALAERGSRAVLETFHEASPVIWTTVATGLDPDAHGITDFVVPTEDGDVPVSSTLRRAPALWNMLSTVGRSVAVVGWWASWPAEEVSGVVVSDRALADLEDRVFPASLLPRLEAAIRRATELPPPTLGQPAALHRDRVFGEIGEDLLEDGFDLSMVYLRAVDITSHGSWKYFEPERFEGIPPEELERRRHDIPAAYRDTDRIVGRLVEAAGPEVNVIVVSDHGFRAAREERVRILLDLDSVLERLGYLERGEAGIDHAKSRAFTYGSPLRWTTKVLRFELAERGEGGRVSRQEVPDLIEQLTADLGRVTYRSGQPVFRVRAVEPKDRPKGGDLVVEVSTEGASRELRFDGSAWTDSVQHLDRISGIHSRSTHGILIAAGPDIAQAADLEGMRVHDVAPTLLYGLGLPVAEDFPGRARTQLFDRGFRRRFDLEKITSWGGGRDGSLSRSAVDGEILDELRALGYLD